MKNVKTIFAIIIATFTVSSVLASGGLRVNMSNAGSEITAVEISNAGMSNFEVKLVDSFGEKIYSMKTKAPLTSFSKKYDFSLLEDGTYWYSVKTDNEKMLKKFKVEDGKSEILEVRKSIDPHFKMDEKMLKISFLNPQLEKVKLYVYDKSDNLLAEENLGADFSINKAVSFADLNYGEYDVVIANNLDIYEYKVSLD